MRKTILQEIRHIKFPFLQELYLFGNNIDSIELIHHIELPSLSSISLSICFFIKKGENEITSLGPMKKVCWKNLKILSIKKAGRKI